MEARGFIVGTPVAIRLGVGFIMLRKPNKLPGAKISLDFYKEYSPDAKVLPLRLAERIPTHKIISQIPCKSLRV